VRTKHKKQQRSLFSIQRTFLSSLAGAIRNFLNKWPVRPCSLGDLADEIADQAQIGTVVIQEQMGDIFAFITALNLGPHRASPFAPTPFHFSDFHRLNELH
jgi:hypothetical protein